MFEKIKLSIISFVVKKYALGFLIKAYVFVKGYKTQICMVGMAIAWLLDVFNLITTPQAEQVYIFLGGAGSVAFMAKLKSYQDMAEKIAAEVVKGAAVEPPKP